MGYSDYSGFSVWLRGYCERKGIDYESQLQRLPQPGANSIPDFDVEEGVEGLSGTTGPWPAGELRQARLDGQSQYGRLSNDRLYRMVRSSLGIKQPRC